MRGVQRAVHARIEEDAAGGIADADEVDVRIPNARRIEAFPCGFDEFVLGKAPRQADEAGIPEPLLRPEPPRRKRARAGERGAAQQKVASFQECVRRASS
jgi:hypothetical protein